MALFQYRGRNQRGEAVSGRIEAASTDAVADQLFNSGVIPIDILPTDISRDVVGGLRALTFRLTENRVGLDDLIFFCRQMHTLLKAGVPILQALRGLRETTRNPALARVIGRIGESLDAGFDLTTAIGRHPDVFPPLFGSMVQVGETTGGLPESFQQLGRYLEREKETRDRVRQAVRYPVIVLCAIAAALFIINIFVIPAFANVYAGFRAELPAITRMLVGISDVFARHWHWMLAGAAALAVALRVHLKTPEGRYRWDRIKLRLPIVGSIFRYAALARFSRSLSIALRAGVPLVQAFTVVSRSVGNDFIGQRVLQMRDGIERGETITRTAIATSMFPALVLQMLSVGEETGAVDGLLGEVADYYDREVDYTLKGLSAALEPILLVAVGIMVLILALGVFLPMWDLAKAARG